MSAQVCDGADGHEMRGTKEQEPSVLSDWEELLEMGAETWDLVSVLPSTHQVALASPFRALSFKSVSANKRNGNRVSGQLFNSDYDSDSRISMALFWHQLLITRDSLLYQ